MSKQSEAKINQGWSKTPMCCATCGLCNEVKTPRNAWPEDTFEKVGRSCAPGGFAVKPNNSCRSWKPRT